MQNFATNTQANPGEDFSHKFVEPWPKGRGFFTPWERAKAPRKDFLTRSLEKPLSHPGALVAPIGGLAPPVARCQIRVALLEVSLSIMIVAKASGGEATGAD